MFVWRISLIGIFLYLGATIAAGHEWTDSSGKYKVEASFVWLSLKNITLEKTDGTRIEVPLSKLSKQDQERAKNLHKDLIQAALFGNISSVFSPPATADTSAKVLLLEKEAAATLAQGFDGTPFAMSLPVLNVEPFGTGKYRLKLGPPNLPSKRQYLYRGEVEVRLSKKDVMSIGKESTVVLSGTLRIAYAKFDYSHANTAAVTFRSPRTTAVIYLDLVGMQVDIDGRPASPASP